MTMCQWCPGYASWTDVVGIEPYELFESRDWISASGAPSGANGTKKWPFQRFENAGGAVYDATPSTGRWNTGEGTTSHDSPRRHRDEARLDEERPSLRGPFGVGLEHRLLRRRVAL